MRIAITGCNGRVGKRVVILALQRGHTVVGIDYASEPDTEVANDAEFIYIKADLKDYSIVMKVLEGCEGVAHLAGIPGPGDYQVDTHNSNVTISWNVLRACAELGITRIAQASSVNVITLVFSQEQRYKYFPIDEVHPCEPDEPYGLSKMICEMQADTIVRRYPKTRIASLRLHWVVPNRAVAAEKGIAGRRTDLWGYAQHDSAADAFLLAITSESDRWSGHEAFFIAAPRTAFDVDVRSLRETYFPDVPIKGMKEFSGQVGFFSCEKAKELLGWVHRDGL